MIFINNIIHLPIASIYGNSKQLLFWYQERKWPFLSGAESSKVEDGVYMLKICKTWRTRSLWSSKCFHFLSSALHCIAIYLKQSNVLHLKVNGCSMNTNSYLMVNWLGDCKIGVKPQTYHQCFYIKLQSDHFPLVPSQP